RWAMIQRRKASKRPDSTAMLYRAKALNTIHITGHSAKAKPATVLSTIMLGGSFQTKTEITAAAISPDKEAIQAGFRDPNRARTTTMGMDATRKDRPRLLPTGVSNW